MPRVANYRKVSNNPEKGWHNVQSSKILQLGLGDEVLRLRELGWSRTKIAELLGFDRFTVSLFIQNWEAMSPEQRAEMRQMMREQNVWDLSRQVQDLFDTIRGKMEELDEKGDLRLHREYVAEQRQLLQLVGTMLEKAAKLEHQKSIVQVVLQEIAAESPECRNRIVQRLRNMKDVSLLLGGNQ